MKRVERRNTLENAAQHYEQQQQPHAQRNHTHTLYRSDTLPAHHDHHLQGGFVNPRDTEPNIRLSMARVRGSPHRSQSQHQHQHDHHKGSQSQWKGTPPPPRDNDPSISEIHSEGKTRAIGKLNGLSRSRSPINVDADADGDGEADAEADADADAEIEDVLEEVLDAHVGSSAHKGTLNVGGKEDTSVPVAMDVDADDMELLDAVEAAEANSNASSVAPGGTEI